MENIINKIKAFDQVEGSILISGFRKGEKPIAVLTAMKNKGIKSRDFTIVDTFENSPWQLAYDFCNEVKNRVKKNGTYLKTDLETVKLDILPSIVIIDHNSVEMCYKLIRKYLIESSDKAMIICTNTSISVVEINKLTPSGFKKSTTIQLPTKEVVIVKEKSDLDKIKTPVRTRSVLT